MSSSRGILAFYHKTVWTEAGPPQADQTWVCVLWVAVYLVSPGSVCPFQPKPVIGCFSDVSQPFDCSSLGLTPISLRSVAVELATKPLDPTSTWHTSPSSLGPFALGAKLKYCCFLCWQASYQLHPPRDCQFGDVCRRWPENQVWSQGGHWDPWQDLGLGWSWGWQRCVWGLLGLWQAG